MNNAEFTEKYYMKKRADSSVKWQRGRQMNCLPMWVADMDFRCDERIAEHLKKFIDQGDFGYANLPEDYYKVFCDWHQRRNQITYEPEWIRFSKGAVNAMYQVIYALTKEGDGIMINTPLYPPFRSTIKECGRKVVESKLIDTDGYFTFNYADIEKKFKAGKVRMLMLCSPHNPIGRVWKKGELEELFELCRRYDVLVCADEVHSDIIMPDQTFLPALSFRKYRDRIISITAASKSFSLAVFSHCHVIIPGDSLRKRFIQYQRHNNCSSVNVFNALPTYYGYRYSDEWMDSLNNVIFENYSYIRDSLGRYMEMSVLEGSYLLFLNLEGYNTEESAAECLIKNCGILANAGETFGKDYQNWVRLNLATSLNNVKKAVREIRKLVKKSRSL